MKDLLLPKGGESFLIEPSSTTAARTEAKTPRIEINRNMALD